MYFSNSQKKHIESSIFDAFSVSHMVLRLLLYVPPHRAPQPSSRPLCRRWRRRRPRRRRFNSRTRLNSLRRSNPCTRYAICWVRLRCCIDCVFAAAICPYARLCLCDRIGWALYDRVFFESSRVLTVYMRMCVRFYVQM